MKCEHCGSLNLNKKYLKSSKVQADKTKRYFRYCRSCGYNSYYKFPEYLPEVQFDQYLQQTNQKGESLKSGKLFTNFDLRKDFK
jgi:hypothetical protein